jgi:hypothetical protein
MTKLFDALDSSDVDFIYCSTCGGNADIFKNLLTDEYWCQSCAKSYEVKEDEEPSYLELCAERNK